MTTSQQSRLGSAPEEGVKAPVVTISSGQETLFDVGQSIGGVVVADQDRVAINAQTDPLENGIYIARAGKDWERSTDFNRSDDVQNGQLLSDENTSAVYTIIAPDPWTPGQNSVNFGLLLSPVGFFWGAITGTLSNQADLQIELDAKSNVGHTHVEADITDLQAYLTDAAGSIAMDGELYLRQDAAWVSIDFSVFAPAVHTHVEADITDLQPYLLDAPSDNELYARANGAWQGFSTASGTTGEVIGWPHDEVPQNFLECNGQSVNAVTFADLFAVLGYKYGGSGANFNLPDYRGEFLRGWDHGRGADPDAASRTDRGDGVTGNEVGTKQAAAVGPHAHTFSAQQAIGNFTDNGGAPDERSTQQNRSTSTTGSGIGSDTRGRNVQLMYIIRYTGGGSGITQPPSIEVQDSGITQTTAVQLLNFEGFTITQPLTDQITIQFGSSPNSAVYCPGYFFDYINDTQWRIIGFDVTQLFSVGRRLQFVDGAALYFGTIISTSLAGGNTTMTMSMEDSEILTNSITEVCLTTNATSWSPIAGDPFGGTRINGIANGEINGTQYWVIVGNAGRIAHSTDGGLTWTLGSSGTSENINDVAYSPDDEAFLAVANADTYTYSTDGETWAAFTGAMAADPQYVSGPADISSCCYDLGGAGWRMLWDWDGTNMANAYSTDQTATWDSTPNIGTQANIKQMKTKDRNDTNAGPQGSVYATHQDILTFGIIPDETGSSLVNHSGEDRATAVLCITQLGAANTWNGHEDGNIMNNTADVDANTASDTFGTSAIREFAFSPVHKRLIAVADDGKIGYLDEASVYVNPAFRLVANGGNPLSHFTCVGWNDSDGMFVACNDDGQILRSSNGLDTVPPPDPFSGWTAIAADPFSGGNIQHIATGVISGVQWWVIAGSTLIFTSIDAGISWISRTSGVSGSITDLKYDSTNEAFVATCANGDFTRTTDGSTWAADTTTVQGLAGLVGSGAINSLVWSPSSGRWWVILEYNLSQAATFSVSADLSSWIIADLTTTSSTNPPNAHIYDANIGGRTLYTGIGISYMWYTDVTDTAPTSINNMDANVTAGLGKAGTLGDPQDMFIGNNVGKIELMSSNTVRAINLTALDGPVNAFAYSSMVDRMIAVGNAGEIKTQAGSEIETVGTWRDVETPFGGNINDVDYNATDDIFICVCADGVIARSVDGIS